VRRVATIYEIKSLTTKYDYLAMDAIGQTVEGKKIVAASVTSDQKSYRARPSGIPCAGQLHMTGRLPVTHSWILIDKEHHKYRGSF
jgi:hypothetical protein